MKQIILTRGLPGSGKTRWALSLLEKHPGQFKRINKDDLRSMVDGGQWSKKNEKLIIQARNELTILYLSQGFSVIIDDTNFEKLHLETMEEIAKRTDAQVEVKDFTHVPVEECIENDLKRSRSVGKDVIMKMHNRYIKKNTTFASEYPRLTEHDTSLPKAVIFDLDGTTAFAYNRSYYDYSKVDTDIPNHDIINLIRRFYIDPEVRIIFLSGRKDECREMTEEWIKKNVGISDFDLLMRKTDDNREDSIIKEEIYRQSIKPDWDVLHVIDDRLRVCRMWYRIGLPVLRTGDPDADF